MSIKRIDRYGSKRSAKEVCKRRDLNGVCDLKRRLGLFCGLMSLVLIGCSSQQSYETQSFEGQTIDEASAAEQLVIDHSDCRLEGFEQAQDGDNKDAIYDGVKHHYILDLPEVTEGAPLILMLHGYGESAEGFRRKTNFEQAANAMGYAVVYVTGAPNPEDATSANGWNSGIGSTGNRDVEFLCALSNELCLKYFFDSERVFVVGFSNGAFMTHRLALEAGDTFAAVVSVAGMMPESMWDERPENCEIGVFQITGEKDDVVPKNSDGSAKYSKAPAIEEVMEYYVTGNGLSLADTSSIGKQSVLEKYTSPNTKKQVWNMFIPGGRHSWPEEQFVEFDVNQLILEFLETQ